MRKARHYPPSQIRYQIEHPPITVHLNRRVKENIDKVKGVRSYAQVISELLEGTFDLEKEIKSLPATESVVQYFRGFKEGENRYARHGICSKCRREGILWSDGRCVDCHKIGLGPDYSYFRDKESAAVVDEDDFEKSKVKISDVEKIVYENGRNRGYDNGWAEGYSEAESVFRITYPCSVCGKSMVMYPGRKDHKDMIQHMKDQGWSHSECLKNN